jgi:hypothetical protein
MSDLVKLEYRVWLPASTGRPDPVLQLKSAMVLVDYRLRVNLRALGIDATAISTKIHWTTDLEFHFTIEAREPAELLSHAWKRAVEAIGLETKLLDPAS